VSLVYRPGSSANLPPEFRHGCNRPFHMVALCMHGGRSTSQSDGVGAIFRRKGFTMTFAFSQHDIEAVAALPPLPAMSPRVQAKARDADAEFARALKQYKADSLIWRANLSQNLQRLKEMMAVAAEPGDDKILRFLRDDVLPRLTASVDAAIKVLGENRATQVGTKAKLDQIDSLSPRMAQNMRRLDKQYWDIVDEQYNDVVEIYYGLLALRAEYDPDARGGPSFENVEDLIDSLHS
jgi:hypothetical protein